MRDRPFSRAAAALGLLMAATAPAHAQAPAWDVLIRGGTVIDGSGAARFRGDVAIRGDRIVRVSRIPLRASDARRVIDATGRVVSPGFIDLHAHLEPLLELRGAESAVRQGVTLSLGGPDGGGPFPLAPYLDSVTTGGIGMNVAYLVGHNAIRERVMGRADRAPTPAELQRMQSLIAQGMREGAFGLSTGLRYVPGFYSTTDEVVALARVAAGAGGIYTSHLREEGRGLIEGVGEAIEIARRASIPVVLTHHKAVGQAAWGRSRETLAMVDAARKRRLDVQIDQYPYTASSTSLSVLIPPWALANGDTAFARRVRDPVLRDSIERGIVDLIMNDRGGGSLRRVQFARVSWMPELEGKTLHDWAVMQQKDTLATRGAGLVIDGQLRGGASAIFHIIDEDDVRRIMAHPQTMIASDGRLSQMGVGKPHPRAYGTFPRVLGHYVRDLGVLTLEQGVHKMTGMPAKRLRLTDRGVLREGAFADVVVFDPTAIADRSTFETLAYPSGIDFVFVNGVAMVDTGAWTDQRPGRVIRRPRRR